MKFILVLVLLAALCPLRSSACTAFTFNSGGQPFIAKNLDWFTDQGAVFLNQRNVEKKAFGPAAFSWQSRFASLTFSQTASEFPWEGMNEAGVVVTVLQLIGSRPPGAADPRPELNQLQFIQYILDRSANLREAIAEAQAVRVSAPSLVHFFVCDASGACAVFENLDGQFVVHETLDTNALANNRYLDSALFYKKLSSQLADHHILQTAKSQSSLDRAARASVWSKVQVAPEVAVDYGFRSLENVAELFPDYRTYWSLIFQPRTRTIHYRTTQAPETRSVSFDDFDLECARGSRMVDINKRAKGNVNEQLMPVTAEKNRYLLNRDVHLTPQMRSAIDGYLKQATRCVSPTSKRLRGSMERPL